MGRRAKFDRRQFADAALDLAANHGPEAVTVAAIAGALGAPVGSVYHRFASREALLAEAWLGLVESFQAGLLAALESDDALAAALHTPRWVRANPTEGRVLLLYRREELLSDRMPAEVGQRAEALGLRVDKGLRGFARRQLGSTSKPVLQRLTYAVLDAPYGAVRRYLRAGQPPPSLIDDLVVHTMRAVLDLEARQ